MSDSIWSDGGRIQMPQYEKLTRIKKVDVTIVGGGLCGLLCAYFLKEAGVECLLLEGSRIGSGTVRHRSFHLIRREQYVFRIRRR